MLIYLFLCCPDSDRPCGANLTLISGYSTGAAFPFGTTTVSYVATGNDGAALRSFCNFSVQVLDTQAPTITCPNDIVANNTYGYCGANVSFVPPVGLDNCPNVTTTLTGGKAPGSYFAVGTVTKQYTAREGHHPSALTTDCTFSITVVDVDPPQITCPATVSHNTDLASALLL